MRNTGQFDKALASLNKAIALHPEFLAYYLQKGGIYSQLGDLEAVQKVRDKMADAGASEWTLGFNDVHISFIKEDPTGTRETINWLMAQIQGGYNFHLRLGSIALAQGDIQLSREIYLSTEPRWLEPDQWPELVERHRSNACLVAWVLINTGDEKLGSALLRQAISYFDDSLPLLIEHSDMHHPDICYLMAGDIEKTLLSIETQLAHNHLKDWYIVHPMPMYDLIRHEPRYQAAWAEHERRLSVQRENVEKMAADT